MAVYLNIAFEMAAIICIFCFAGRWLDDYFLIEKNICTIILTPLGVILSLYVALKDFVNKK